MELAYSEKVARNRVQHETALCDSISKDQDYQQEIDISSPFLFQILTDSYTANSECWQDKKKRQQRDQTKLSFENAHRLKREKLEICGSVKNKNGKEPW